MKELTRAEEQVMQILWDIEKGFVKDLLAKMNSPKPAYNTISTIVRILERKGFVDHQAYGKSHEYFPIVSKDEYRRFSIDNLLSGYFSGSFANLASFFAKDGKMELHDLERILDEVKEGVGESN
ncbi:MAG TPA: BlaI/MecI/CopY family transcriptional regulator [Lunatimonas sp.]|nr:BlaI/MecI/CopY family transcriptional regulator [Lunatimonas sp.]